jgi:hypothetical protein
MYTCAPCGHQRQPAHIAWEVAEKRWICHLELTVAPNFRAGDHCEPPQPPTTVTAVTTVTAPRSLP